MKNIPRFLLLLCALCVARCALAQVVPAPQPITPGQRPATTPRAPTPTPPRTPANLARQPAAAAERPAADGSLGEDVLKNGLKFSDASSDIILQIYADLSGKTLIYHPQAPKANITLFTNPKQTLTVDDYLFAIRQALNQNGIDIRPFGDGSLFLNVVPLNIPNIANPDMPQRLEVSTNGVITAIGEPPFGRSVSVVYPLRYISTDEGKKIIEPYKRPEGQIISVERNNSLYIADTYENVVVMVKLLFSIDEPIPVTEDVYARKILFAKAADIKRQLEAVVNESQRQTQGTAVTRVSASGSPTMVTEQPRAIPTPIRPAVIRPGATPTPDAPVNNASIDTAVSDADRGMIRGKVQIIDDERTNMLIIITNPPNMEFFDKLIAVFDVETAPPVVVDVIRMEHAKAADVASLLNDLLGASAPANAAATPRGTAGRAATETLADAANRTREAAPAVAANLPEGAQSRISDLNKDNIKILNDERSNAVIIMASPSDLATLRELITSIDIQLSQVLIEIVVLDVALNNNFELGIDWVNRHFSAQGGHIAGGGFGGAGGALTPVNLFANVATNIFAKTTSGLSYFLTSDKINIDMVLRAAADDNNSRVLASPVLLTMDNKEATIKATQLRYLFNGYINRYGSNQYGTVDLQPDIQQRDIGLTVTVTPRINQNGMVVLTIAQQFQTVVEPGQKVGDDFWPTVNTREINADVAVNNAETVILGGLIQRETGKSKSGIPYLRNIPLLGWMFGSVKETEKRSELLVFMTPYVLDNASQRALQTQRLHGSIGKNADIWTTSFSGSPLAASNSDEEIKRLVQQWASEDEARKSIEKLEKLQRERDAELQKLRQRQQSRPAPVQPVIQQDNAVLPPKPNPNAVTPLRVSVDDDPDVIVLERIEAAGFLETLPGGE